MKNPFLFVTLFLRRFNGAIQRSVKSTQGLLRSTLGLLRLTKTKVLLKPQLPTTSYVTVVIPALNEAKRIADVVAYALQDKATAQVIVIDDSSIDATAALARAAGATVLTSSMLGKGASMRDGLGPATCDLVAYLDGDLAGLRPGIISDLCLPILQGRADLVKAKFGREGGRVTELTAKPMLKIFFPELAKFSQPLGGIIAAKKSLLNVMRFEDGYGVDVGLLIDAHLAGAKIVEVDIGSLEHESQPLPNLALMANEVGRVIFDRAKIAGRLHVEQVTAMFETQRLAEASLDAVLMRRKGRTRLLLLDMDTIVTQSPYTVELARFVAQESALEEMIDSIGETPVERRHRVAKLFRYTHKNTFEQVARQIELKPGVIETVNQMRRNGFMVGLITDSYFVGAEIIRRRVFADFAMAHLIQFEADVCTGQFTTNTAFVDESIDLDIVPKVSSKANVLRHFMADDTQPRVAQIWVLSNNYHDADLIRGASRAFTTLPRIVDGSDVVVLDSIESLSHYLVNDEAIDFAA